VLNGGNNDQTGNANGKWRIAQTVFNGANHGVTVIVIIYY